MKNHPCISCGACCAFFRVSFYWTETLESSHGVPGELTRPLNEHRNSMNGTDQQLPRCVALSGRVGTKTKCEIYENRPSPCRDFKASFEDGTASLSCDEARAGSGLAPLNLLSWVNRSVVVAAGKG